MACCVFHWNVVIKCESEKDVLKLEQELVNKLSDDYEIKTSKLRNPRIKITRLNKSYDTEELEGIIKTQNFPEENNFKILHIKHIRSKDTYTVFAETSTTLFHRLMDNKKLYIEWSRCPVYEDLNITRCFKCNGYNHSSIRCKNEESCFQCAGKHPYRECDKTHVQCINCTLANHKFKLNYNTGHTSYDENCPTYKYYINLTTSQIKY